MPPYQWNASDYEKNSTQQQVWARELIAKLNLQGDETLLDIGCGDGKVTTEIAAGLPAGRVVGVDNSREMIALAQQRYPQQNFPNLSFCQEDARNLPFCNEFMVIFSNATLHWVRDHSSVLRGISKSLKPVGKILLQMGGQGNAAGIVSALDQMIVFPKWAGYFKDFEFPYGFYGPEEYRDWLAEAGLSPVRVELVPKDMTHAGAEGLAGWFRTTWMPYTHRVPVDLQEAFIAEFVSFYIARVPLDDQGKTHVKMIRLEVEALKL
jgi:trans-aconitate 2-methyltransferase